MDGNDLTAVNRAPEHVCCCLKCYVIPYYKECIRIYIVRYRLVFYSGFHV